MSIKSIFIQDLFGIKENNREINFNSDLTIIVGKNGAGKTTTLNIINSIINQKFHKLFKYTFTYIEVDLLNSKIEIYNEDNKVLKIFHEKNGQEKVEKLTISKGSDRPVKKLSYLLDTLYFPTYRRLETDLMALIADSMEERNSSKNESFYSSYSYSMKRAIEEIPFITQNISDTVLGLTHRDITTIIEKKWNEVNEFEKKELNNLINDFLLSLLEPETNNVNLWDPEYEFNPSEVKRELQQMFQQVGIMKKDDEKKQNLILQYVERIEWANTKINKSFKDEKEREKSDYINDFSKVIDISLSYSRIDQLLSSYRETHNAIMEKRKPFKDLVNTLNEFLDIQVDIFEGNLFFIKGNTLLKFEDLSAGEKQLVALFVYTKIHITKNTIVIIDEPELSLHINWQRKFLKHLASGDKQIQYVVSTHSPFIISNYQNNIYKLADIGESESEAMKAYE